MLQERKSAADATNTRDAKVEPSQKNSQITVTAPCTAGKAASADELAALFNGEMFDPTLITEPEPLDDEECIRLRVVVGLQAASRQRTCGMYWFDRWDPDRAYVRWVQGPCEETVCRLEFDIERVLFLEDRADNHTLLQEMFERMGWEVGIVDGLVTPTCPECNGAGQEWITVEFTSSSFEGLLDCPACHGSGVLR